MKKFETFNSTVVPMLIDHVDTDQIIPARFLKTTSKDGIGENLFRDWRFDAANQPIADFVLNQEIGQGRILFAGENFGCGSSREHAVWALQDYGFDAVIAPSFANIFKRNALNNGLLPIVLDQAFYNEIKEHLYVRSTRLEIDLMSQSVKHLESGRIGEFDIDSFRKECILKGYSDLDYLVSIKQEINDFEKSHVVPQIRF